MGALPFLVVSSALPMKATPRERSPGELVTARLQYLPHFERGTVI